MATAEKITALRGMRDVFSADTPAVERFRTRSKGMLRLHSYVAHRHAHP